MANRIIDLPLTLEVVPRLVEPGVWHRTPNGINVFTYTGTPYWECNVTSGPVNFKDTPEERVPAPTLSIGDMVRFPHKNAPIAGEINHGGAFDGTDGSFAYDRDLPDSIGVDDFLRMGGARGRIVRVVSISGRNVEVSPAISASGSLRELCALTGTIKSFASGRIVQNIRGPYNFVVEVV